MTWLARLQTDRTAVSFASHCDNRAPIAVVTRALRAGLRSVVSGISACGSPRALLRSRDFLAAGLALQTWEGHGSARVSCCPCALRRPLPPTPTSPRLHLPSPRQDGRTETGAPGRRAPTSDMLTPRSAPSSRMRTRAFCCPVATPRGCPQQLLPRSAGPAPRRRTGAEGSASWLPGDKSGQVPVGSVTELRRRQPVSPGP